MSSSLSPEKFEDAQLAKFGGHGTGNTQRLTRSMYDAPLSYPLLGPAGFYGLDGYPNSILLTRQGFPAGLMSNTNVHFCDTEPPQGQQLFKIGAVCLAGIF